MSDVLLSFGVQNAKADASKMISDLEAAFSNSDPVQVKVGLKVDKSALNTFKSQLSQIVNSISLSNGAPITVKIDGLGDISSKTDGVTESLDSVSKSARNVKKSLDEMTTSQQRSALNKLNTLITQIQTNSAKWASAENGEGSKTYAKYTEQVDALRQLRTEVEAGTVSANDFADRFSAIKAAASGAATELKGINLERLAKEQKEIATGTQEWNSAMLKATKLSSEIKEHLASWTAAKNGKSKDSYSELSNYDIAMDSLIDKLKTGKLTNKEFASSFANISVGATKASSDIKVAGEATQSLGDKIKSTVEKLGIALTAAKAVQLVVKAVKEMVSEVIEIDTAMTELKKVTDETDATYSKFLDNAADRAKSVGATMTDVVTATADFARLGYSIDEASNLSDVALIYNNVADGISGIDEASQSIISTMQAFGIEANSAITIADKFNAVGNKFAISSGGIGEAMQRSASALYSAGNTIDQSIALITAANTTIQDESKVGNAMKTISLRIRGAKTELEEAGETTEGMAESTSKLREQILALSGVDIMLDENTFKSSYQILDELSQKWKSLGDIQQASLTELMAGKNQANVFNSLMSNFNIARDALDASVNSAGSAIAENAKQMESIEGHIKNLKTNFTELATNLISSDLVKFFVDAGTFALSLANGIVKVVNSLGGLKTVLAAVTGTIAAINISSITQSLSNFGDILLSICDGTHIKSFISKMKKLPEAMREAESAGKGLDGALQAVGISASTAQIAIMAITVAITAAVAAYSHWRQTIEQQRQEAIEAAKASAEEADSIMDLYSAYKIAGEAYQSNSGSKEALVTATSELLQALGIEEDKISELVGTYGDLDNAINNVTSDVLEKAVSDAISGYNAAYDDLQDSVGNGTDIWAKVKKYFGFGDGSEILSWNQELESVNQKIKSVLTNLGIMNESDFGTTGGIMVIDTDSVDGLIASYDRLIMARDALQKELTTDEYNDSHAVDVIEGKISALQPIIQGYLDARQLLNESQAKLTLFNEFTNTGVPETAEDVVELRNRLVEAAIASGDFAGSADDIGAAFNSAIGEFSYMSPAIADAVQLLNDAAEAADKFHDRITMEQPEIAGGNRLQHYVEKLQELGLTDIDLQSFVLNPDSTEDGAAAFRALAAAADEYGISVDALIPLLVKWGYVSSNASSQAEDGLSSLQSAAKSAADTTQDVLSIITGAQEMISSQSTGKSISVENFNTAELNGYADALEYVNGSLQLNIDRVNELVKAKAAEQIATNDANKAAAQTKYLENAKQIRELRKELAECGDDKKDLRAQIEKNIATLTSENSSLRDTITEYDVMNASLREATSAYQHWLNAQNASQTGDMFDSSLSAIQHISDTLNNTKSDLYGRIGRSDYKAAVDFIVPDSVDKEDADAVASYIDSISDMFTYDSSGNRAGLNIANFCQQAVDAGLMVLNDAGTSYEIVGGKTMEDFANGLGLALPLVQAMFGELQEYGADFSWADEAEKTLGDLAVAASDAVDALSAIDGNETLEINIDSSDVEVLESTIKEMQGLKVEPGVDASEIEYANQIIEYCLAKKQLLCAPDIMMVDTSVVEGNLGNAIAILQEFQSAKDALEQAEVLGVDTTQAQANLDAATAKVQELDSNITSEKALNIDTTSIDTISASLQSLTADLIVKAGVDESAVIGYQQSEHDSTGTVTMEVDSSAVDKYIAQTKVASGTVVWNNDTRLVKTVFSANGYINWVNSSGPGSANGTAHAGGTAKAGGDWGTAPGGKTLVGELGPEIVVNVHTGKWYTVGDNGAEFRDIPPGSIVFNHKQSKALLEHGYVSGRGHSMASGTAMVSGSIPVNGRYPSSGSGSSGGSGSGSSGGSNSSSSSSDDAKTWFEEAYAYHQHLLAMDQESMEDYLRWLEDAYRQAYAEGIIELEDLYKYEEECYEKSKEIFNDYLNDIEFKIDGLARQDGTASQIVNIYLSAIQDINRKIAEARVRGLDDNDDYIQELIKKLYEYEDAIEDIRDDATDNAKNAVDDLIQYRIKMLKQDLQNEKDALEDKKSALKDFYSEQKQMLQDAYDEEKTQEERAEKRKAKADIEAELAQLEFDDSAWAQKRKLELQEELAEAQKDLDDFEKEQTLNNTQDMLDDMYEKQAEQIQTEIDAIEEALNNPEALYNQALRDIQNNTEALFEEMVQYNARYGDGDPSTVKEMWDEAKKSLDDFLETFGRAYKDIILVDSPSGYSGYASGTSSAADGIHEVDEKGAEWLFTSGDGTKYRVFSGGEKVLDANATNFLYNFATTGGKILSDAFSSLLNAITTSRISNHQQPLQISTGNIIIEGNANERTVSEIRRAQRDNVEYILKEFTKLNK